MGINNRITPLYMLNCQIKWQNLFVELAVARSWAKEASQQRLRAAMRKEV